MIELNSSVVILFINEEQGLFHDVNDIAKRVAPFVKQLQDQMHYCKNMRINILNNSIWCSE